jgi:preprotein translocase SecE subunit
MLKYRPGEGVFARGTAFWSLAGFAFLAGRRLYFWVQRWEFPNRVLVDDIPVLGMPLTPAFLMGVALFLGAAFGLLKLINAPKVADLLIETELEMKKVTWPSADDSRKASFVVFVCVVIFLAFFWVADASLEWIFFDWVYAGGPHGQ